MFNRTQKANFENLQKFYLCFDDGNGHTWFSQAFLKYPSPIYAGISTSKHGHPRQQKSVFKWRLVG